jgi:hypothetical protein
MTKLYVYPVHNAFVYAGAERSGGSHRRGGVSA